jgi:PAS domain S-box-containing protein
MTVDGFDLRRALDEDAVVPVFQAVTELRSGECVGFEVLARWQHPEQGLILPANFIALAEEHGLIGTLSERVFRKAFQAGLSLPPSAFLAVNVSPTQLREQRLAQLLQGWAEQSGFPLSRVTVEITETALLDNLELARSVAGELKELGCSLALDDFGTGYSSLLHLQALPFDKLKIDRGFVKNMLNSRESRKIVAGVIGLAHSLDLVTVAEGIETEEQAQMLQAFGCHLGQGWFYGRPQTADATFATLGSPPRKLVPAIAGPEHTLVERTLEARPAESFAHLQALYNGAPVGLCYLDHNLRYVSINQRLAEMNRRPLLEHIGRAVQEIHPDKYPLWEPYLLRALRGEAIHGVEIQRPSAEPGGPSEYNLASYQPAWDPAGEVIGLSIAVVDITALKQAEEALRERDDLYRHLFEIKQDVPWITDAKGMSLHVNSRWSRDSGWRGLPMHGRHWLENLHPEDSERSMKAFMAATSAGISLDIEYRVGNADDGWRWMRSRGSPQTNAEGKVTYWYGIVEDIDDRKQIEQALLFIQERLRTLFTAVPGVSPCAVTSTL